MRLSCPSGSSLLETLVALALVTSVGAALLPALAMAARLQRESDLETGATLAGSRQIAQIAREIEAAGRGTGGALDIPRSGWQQFVDRDGAPAPVEDAVFDCRWLVTRSEEPAGLLIVHVRVVPLADRGRALTFTTGVPNE
ncbi:MAG: hypothetical protein M3R55_12335 [Acidobacteriota bacterium]|nr:hypothetical protein [Acidobacteriota bacterium]